MQGSRRSCGGDFADRTYPGSSTRRVVWYNYASTGVGAPLGRVDNIADDDTSPTDTYADYTYLGASTVVKVEYPGVTSGGNTLALTYGTSADSYAGLDPASLTSFAEAGPAPLTGFAEASPAGRRRRQRRINSMVSRTP